MAEWTEGQFDIIFHDGFRTVTGLVSGIFGIHHDSERDPAGWVVTHLGTGYAVASWQPFWSVETAKEFAARIEPLTDWSEVDVDNPPVIAFKIQEIAEELLGGEGQKITI